MLGAVLEFLYVAAHLGLLLHWRRFPRVFRWALLPWTAQAVWVAWMGKNDMARAQAVWWPLEHLVLVATVAVLCALVAQETRTQVDTARWLIRFAVLVLGAVFSAGAMLWADWRGDGYAQFLVARACLKGGLGLSAAVMLALDAYGACRMSLYGRVVCGLLLVAGFTSGWITVPEWVGIHAIHRIAFISAAVALTVTSQSPRQ